MHRSPQLNVAFRHVLMVAALLLVLVQPLAAFAQTAEDAAISESASSTETVSTATEEIATETETATEMPTEVATEPATETPTATVVPTETATATEVPAEVTATESERPAPAASEPTPETTSAATATATATPTDEAGTGKKPKTSAAGASIAASEADCTQISGGSTVTTGQYVTFQCNDDHPFKIEGNVSSGWRWTHSWGSVIVPATWQTGSFSPSETSNNNSSYYLYLGPSTESRVGSTGTLTITVRHPNRNTVKNTHVVTAERAPSATDFEMSCSPNAITVLTGDVATVNCSIRAVNLPPFTVVAVAGISLSPVPGWTITRTPSIGLLSGLSPFTFKVTLKPACGAASNPPAPNISISSLLVYGFRSFDGPTTSITALHGAASNVTTTITGSNSDWSRAYSLEPQLVNGSVTYQVVSSGCAGWNVQVSATEFSYTGEANGSPIAGANIAVTPGPPTADSGSTTDVSAGPAGTLNAPITVLSAGERAGAGAYSQTLALGVTIPGGARVGTYTSILTIAAGSGP